MKGSTKITLAIVGGSFAVHFAAWSFVGGIKGERKRDIVAISLAETKKKKDEKKKEPPKPPDIKPEKAKIVQPRTKAPEPMPEQAPPPQQEAKASNMNGYADLNLGAMGGGTGGNGIAVGGGGGGGGGGPAPTATATQRHVALTPVADCGEDLVKPKLERMIRPAYTQEGRQANVEGVVKLEVTVDATGHVVGVKVLKGLGYGLDEAAMSTVRNQWTFVPGTRCGKAVPATIRASVSFGLT
jgi:protein TonB